MFSSLSKQELKGNGIYSAFEVFFIDANYYSFEELQKLYERKRQLFVNQILTDGYTCRLVFARESRMLHGVQNTDLELGNFNTQEIDKHFLSLETFAHFF